MYNDEIVEKAKQERISFKEKNHKCPICEEMTLSPFGGPGHYWIECPCGSYSPIKNSYNEALLDVEHWLEIDPELNARMYPPVGG